MSAKSASTKAATTPLVIPEPALHHHLKTLRGSMEEWTKSRHLPPVLLLAGLNGVGKRSIAYFLSQWILCEKAGFVSKAEEVSLFGGGHLQEPETNSELRPCGKCIQCQRALNATWVDFTEIASSDDDEEESSTGSLKIEVFRRLKESAGFAAQKGSYRIILISNADRMTPQAANSMLKILEEPPRGWIFFLTASDPTLILPTVLSRCQTLKLKPMDLETIRNLLSEAGILGEKQKIAANLSEGSWGRALSLANEDVLEHRQILFHFLERPQGGLSELVDWAAQTPGKMQLLFDQLEVICLDLIRFSVSEPEKYVWSNVDGMMALKNHAQNVIQQQGSLERAREFWVSRSERIAKARREALVPLNKKLLIQDVLMPWLEAAR